MVQTHKISKKEEKNSSHMNSSATIATLQEEVSTLRQVISHLLDSIKSLEAWRAEVSPQLDTFLLATSQLGHSAPPRSSSEATHQTSADWGTQFQAISAAMVREENEVNERLRAAQARERSLRAQYNRLLEADR